MKCTGHNPVGQRMRTPKEREAVERMLATDTYLPNQWENEVKLQDIHETECEACATFAERRRSKESCHKKT